MTDNLDLRVSEKDGWLIVGYAGTINLMNRDLLRDAIVDLLEEKSGFNLAIDLSAVTAIDSAGLGSIFSLYKLLVEKQATLALLGPNASVGSLLELTHLDKVVLVKDSISDLLHES